MMKSCRGFEQVPGILILFSTCEDIVVLMEEICPVKATHGSLPRNHQALVKDGRLLSETT